MLKLFTSCTYVGDGIEMKDNESLNVLLSIRYDHFYLRNYSICARKKKI